MTSQHAILALRKQLESAIVGQDKLLDRLIVTLIAGGHVLVEGLPGLAKTTAVKSLADCIHASFQRVQFTPDLLPGDLTGTDIYNPNEGSFDFAQGPLFHEIVLADEINRAPAKVQSALLEAMQERQITVGGVTRPLPPLFMVMATQNPLEQAGTYPLPEAQLDRFLLHITLDYPSEAEELQVLQRERARLKNETATVVAPTIDAALVLQARAEVNHLHLAPELEQYIVSIVSATRKLDQIAPDVARFIAVGASPRATLAIAHAAQALAYLRGRDFVGPDDILDIAPDCLRHRLIPTVSARVEKVTLNSVIAKLLEAVPVP
jgi:MoxR-like ATPase